MSRLSVHELDVRVGAVTVCEALSLEFAPGQCWVILGRNGSGKTTLLHTLAGLRAPDSGSVRLDSVLMRDLANRMVAQKLGLLPQDSTDAFPATVLETALLGRHPHSSRWGWESAVDIGIARDALRHVDLDGREQREVATLSGGERRRLAVATLLAQAPDILLLDEPTNHLDLHHQIALLNLLLEQVREYGKTVVMVLHDVNLAARYADHCLLLYGNGETCAGACEDILATSVLEKLYRQPLRQVSENPPAWLTR